MTGELFRCKLRSLRIGAGLNQSGLARAVGIDPAYVNRMERFDTAPSRVIVLALGAALGLDDVATDRLLYLAGHAPRTDWQTIAERACDQLAVIRATLYPVASQ